MRELKGPAYNQILDYIRNKKTVELHTVNSKVLKGIISWHDKDVFCLKLTDGKEITVYKNAVVYYFES